MRGTGSHGAVSPWFGAALLVAVTSASGTLSAQVLETLPLAQTYGSGVHAYFAGDYDRSYDDLTAAIEAGSEDPRARYFRGLAALRLGRIDEAEADFTEGADLEARALGGWFVSRSLERVQGHDRLRLERHRSRARVIARQRDLEAERARYSDTMDAQDEVRRRVRPTTIPSPSGSTVTNLFDGQAEAAAVPAPAPAVDADEALPAPGDASDPFEGPMDGQPGADPLDPQPGMELPPAEEPMAEEPVEPLEADTPAPIEADQ